MTRTRRDIAIAAVLFATTFALFSRAMTFEFVNIDDAFYVPGNEIVERGLTREGVAHAFTSVSEGNYIPLTWLSHMLTAELWGVAPGAHHGMSVALHALNAALLFVFLNLATGSAGRSALVAALFALHPLRVESVAWVAERKDVLSGAFWMLTLIAYWNYTRHPSITRYTLVGAAFALGLLSKPMLVTLPCVLFLLDFWPLGRIAWSSPNRWRLIGRCALEKVPLLALSAAASGVALVSQRGVGALREEVAWGLARRIGVSLEAYGTYLLDTVWPLGLAVFYPIPASQNMSLVVLSALAIAIISVLAVVVRRGHPYVLTGWLWFLGVLAPVIGLVPVGAQSHADRYMYLPQIGLLIAIVWAGGRALSARAGTLAGVSACAACAVLTWSQLGHWKNSETLFAHALAVTDDNWFAHGNYAVALRERGDLVGAEQHLRTAVSLGGGRYNDLHNLGVVLLEQERPAEAVEAFTQALEVEPERAGSWYRLGNARLALEQPYNAITAYEEALRIDPDLVDARVNLGIAYGMIGRDEPARAAFERAVALSDPPKADALYSLALFELRAQNIAEARSRFEQLVSLYPEHAGGWYYLAACDGLELRAEASVENLRRAIALDGSLGEAWLSEPLFAPLRALGLSP